MPKIAVICLQLTLFMPVSAATFAPFFAGRQEYFWSYGANAFLEANESESAMFETCRAQIR